MKHLLCVSLVLVSTTAWAHHGKDFLLVETTHIPPKGDVYLISTQDWAHQDDSTQFEGTPGVLFAVGDSERMLAEVKGLESGA